MDNIKISEVIMKVVPKEDSTFKDLEGIEVFVLRFKREHYSNDTMLSPVKFEDYDKFYKWLYNEVKENWFCCSDNFEDFKNELNQNSEELLPSITRFMDEFEYVRDVTKEDGEQHEIGYKKYFLNEPSVFNIVD